MTERKKLSTMGIICLRTRVSEDNNIKKWIKNFINHTSPYNENICPKCQRKPDEKICNKVIVENGGVLAGHFDFCLVCYAEDVESLEDFILECVRKPWETDIILDTQTVVGMSYKEP